MLSRRIHEGWWLALLVALAVALRLFHIEYRSFWTDEFRTLYSIRLPISDLFAERLSYGHFPTYFILLKWWTALAGESEWALRLPSLICVVGALPFIYFMARRAWGVQSALWAAVFYLLNGRGIWAAQEARPYGLVMLAAAGSLHALMNALDHEKPDLRRLVHAGQLWWLPYMFWSALGLVSHATYLFIFIGQALVVAAWMWRRRKSRWDWFAAMILLGIFAGVVYGMLDDYAARHINKAYSDEARGLAPALFREGFLEIFWGDFRLAIGSKFKYIGMPLAAVLIWLAWRGASRRKYEVRLAARAPVFWLSLAWTLSILLIMGLITCFKQDVVRDSRYFAPGLGGACLIMGLAVSSVERRDWRWALGGVVALLLAINAIGWQWSKGEQVRHAVQYVAEHRAANEPVLFCKDTNSTLMAQYYNLGVVPQGFSREELDRNVLRKNLEHYVGNAPGFWLILYKEEHSPIVDVIQQWSAGKYAEIPNPTFAKIAVRHWRK